MNKLQKSNKKLLNKKKIKKMNTLQKLKITIYIKSKY